jgi:hypothetical protein
VENRVSSFVIALIKIEKDMLEQLLSLVKEQAQELIVKNADVPNEHNDAVIGDTARIIQEKIGQAISGGNLAATMGMFANGVDKSNPVVQEITAALGPQLARYGVNPESAANIASTLIPQIMEQFVNRANDPANNQFNINDILKSFKGKGGLDFGGLAGQFPGGENGKGGIGSLLGGLFGK